MGLPPQKLRIYLLTPSTRDGEYSMDKVRSRAVPFLDLKTPLDEIVAGQRDGLCRGIAGFHPSDPRVIDHIFESEYFIATINGRTYIGLAPAQLCTETVPLFTIKDYTPHLDQAVLTPIPPPEKETFVERLHTLIGQYVETSWREQMAKEGKDFDHEMGLMNQRIKQKVMAHIKGQSRSKPIGTTTH